MRDPQLPQPDDTQAQPLAHPIDPDDPGNPNCSVCLTRMEPAVTGGVASWVCASCGAVHVIGSGAPEAAAWVDLSGDDVPHIDDKKPRLPK